MAGHFRARVGRMAGMSRFKRIRDWPECLSRMQPDELQRELRYWQSRSLYASRPSHSTEMQKRVRDIEREIESREISPPNS